MPSDVTVFVCRTCGTPGREDPQGEGNKLAEMLADAAPAGVRVQKVKCMGGCEQPCTVAFSAPGKFSYLYGKLQATANHVAALLAQARLYAASPDGTVLKAARPDPLKETVLFRLPPAQWQSEDGTVIRPAASPDA